MLQVLTYIENKLLTVVLQTHCSKKSQNIPPVKVILLQSWKL